MYIYMLSTCLHLQCNTCTTMNILENYIKIIRRKPSFNSWF